MALKYAAAILCLVALVPAFRAASVGTQEDAETTAKEVRFFLYTAPHNADNGRQLIASDPSTLTGINPSAPLIFLVHGFLQNYQCGFPQDVKDAYLSDGGHPQVITVDYGEMACSGMSTAMAPLCYPSALNSLGTVGSETSKLIQALKAKSLTSANKVHCVGVSLGAHACGRVGLAYTTATGERIARITGLDPAGPSFGTGGTARRLQKGDATWVEAIHTDAGSLGTNLDNGDADYWPNGGKNPQPGCEGQSDTQCSHGTAARLFMQSINGGEMTGYACQSYDAFNSGTCNREATAQAEMGHHNHDSRAAGKFFLHTSPAQTWSGRYTCYQ